MHDRDVSFREMGGGRSGSVPRYGELVQGAKLASVRAYMLDCDLRLAISLSEDQRSITHQLELEGLKFAVYHLVVRGVFINARVT